MANDAPAWRPVVGFEGLYEVCEDGRIRSLPRPARIRGGGIRTVPGHELRPYKMKKLGHLAIDLVPPEGRKFKRRTRVHIVVLEAFVGPRPEGYAACHNDGDVNNNHVSNLRWDTYTNNNYDMVRHGTHHWAKREVGECGHPLDGVWRYADGRFRQRYCKTCHKKRTSDQKAKRLGFKDRAEAEAHREAHRQQVQEFGRQLSEATRSAGLNQVQVAKLLGTSQANIWRWMNGKCAPPPNQRAKILSRFQ